VVSDETLPMLRGDRSNITSLSYVLAWLAALRGLLPIADVGYPKTVVSAQTRIGHSK